MAVSNETVTREMAIGEAIETIVYECLEKTHDGWEINDGACGEFVFDVPLRRMTLDYNQRLTTYESHTHEFEERA